MGHIGELMVYSILTKCIYFGTLAHMSQKPLLTVRFFMTASGNEPVREWLKDDLSAEDRRTIGEDIKTVQFGWPMGMPIVEKIAPDLWAIRTDGLSQGRIARTFFTVQGDLMILLHGFIKKSPKLPPQEIDLARKRLSLLCE